MFNVLLEYAISINIHKLLKTKQHIINFAIQPEILNNIVLISKLESLKTILNYDDNLEKVLREILRDYFYQEKNSYSILKYYLEYIVIHRAKHSLSSNVDNEMLMYYYDKVQR